MYRSLRELTAAFGVAGHEGEALEAILRCGDFSEHVFDNIGNLYCFNGDDPSRPVVLLDAHVDEVGFMVRFIDDEGYVYLEPLGGIDPKCMIGKQLMVRGKEDVVGVASNVPPHLVRDGDIPDIKELPIDTGLSRKEVEELIFVGAPASFIGGLERMGANKVTSKALDNRAGCLILCELSKRFGPESGVAYLFSSQEETGARGASVALKSISPKLAISVDATQGDMHFIKSPLTRELGSGAIIGTGPNIHPRIYGGLVDVATDNEIPFTTKAYAGATPTNLRLIQLSGGGVPTGLISFPLRYMHSPCEVADLRDIDAVISILAHFIDDVNDVIGGDF